MSFLYLGALLVSLGGVVVVDRRFRLFFWRAPGRALVVTLLGLAFFILWDLAGIALGIFARGEAPIATGIELAPEFPVEELVFLIVLCYLTMVLVTGFDLVLAGIRRRRRVKEQAR
jgi:lycopene cyclase domain-containing protein